MSNQFQFTSIRIIFSVGKHMESIGNNIYMYFSINLIQNKERIYNKINSNIVQKMYQTVY